MKKLPVICTLVVLIVLLCPNSACAVEFKGNLAVWSVELSHDEVVTLNITGKLAGGFMPPPVALAVNFYARVLAVVDAYGGNKGVTVTGIGAAVSVVYPKGSLPAVFEVLKSVEERAKDGIKQLQRKCDGIIASWITRMLAGGNKPTPVQGAPAQPLYSLEMRIVLAQKAYLRALGRGVDPEGLRVSVEHLKTNRTSSLLRELMISEESWSKVSDLRPAEQVEHLYLTLLNRGCDPTGKNCFLQMVKAVGSKAAWIATVDSTLLSAEYEDKWGNDLVPYDVAALEEVVKQMYERYLGRAGDQAGIACHVRRLATVGYRETVRGIMMSDEAWSRTVNMSPEAQCKFLFTVLMGREADAFAIKLYINHAFQVGGRRTYDLCINGILDSSELRSKVGD